MAGDWIKMRTNLLDDPRVVAIAGACKREPTTIVGCLYALWAIGDEHSTDGFLPHYTTASIDKAVRLRGFAIATESVGWLAVEATGVRIPRFEEHNGESAKSRALCAKRAANHRKTSRLRNAPVTEPPLRKAHLEEMERRGEETREEPSAKPDGVPPPSAESNPPPLCGAERLIRQWVGNGLSESDRDKLARAERERGEADFVVIHDHPQPATVLFERAIVEAIASSKDGKFQSMGPFLRLVGAIEARCTRDGVWPGEGLERTNGHAREPTVAELLATAAARRAKP